MSKVNLTRIAGYTLDKIPAIPSSKYLLFDEDNNDCLGCKNRRVGAIKRFVAVSDVESSNDERMGFDGE